MIAFFSLRAARSMERISKRWRARADTPNVFHRELLDAIHLLETTRSPGSPWPMKGYPDGKRILLRKSQCHLYFDVNERSARIEILEIWDARRRRPPKL